MKLKLPIVIVLSAFFLTCGKKEDTTQQQQQQPPPQQQQTQTNDPTATTTDKTKEDEKLKSEKKDEEKLKSEKKKEEQKKKEEVKLKSEKKEEVKASDEVASNQEIDFAPIFSKRCVKCHGKDLKGKVEGVPNLTLDKTQSKSAKELISIITKGKQGETEDDEDMPSFKNKLTEEEIIAAAKFVLSH